MDGPGEEFLENCRQLESTYLESDDPIIQSGFSGGRERWVAERSPLIEAIVGRAKDWNLGTGSVLLDLAQFVWAFLRRARGKEWVVSVRPTRSGTR